MLYTTASRIGKNQNSSSMDNLNDVGQVGHETKWWRNFSLRRHQSWLQSMYNNLKFSKIEEIKKINKYQSHHQGADI